MPIPAFLQESPAALLGILTSSSNFDVDLAQRGAWQESISILKEALHGVDGYLYLEFDIPRLGSRIDAVILSGSAVIPIEFKSGEARFSRNAINQAWDYGLDLKNFHEASHDVPIFPILVAPNAGTSDSAWAPPHRDGDKETLLLLG